MEKQLFMKVEDHHPIALIRLSGHCTQLEVYKLKSEAEWQVSDGKRFLILDLLDLSFIDSAGVGVLIQIAEQCRRASGHLSLVCSANSHIKKFLDISTGHGSITHYESAPAALAGVRRQFGLQAPDAAADDLRTALETLKLRVEEVDARLKQIEQAMFRPSQMQPMD